MEENEKVWEGIQEDINRWMKVCGEEREVFGNSDYTKAFELQEENCQPISGSKRQMEMIQANWIIFHCIQTQ